MYEVVVEWVVIKFIIKIILQKNHPSHNKGLYISIKYIKSQWAIPS
jgi:hypothetical protein